MLNRTPGTAPTRDELAAEDRRIEVAAARETALDIAIIACGAHAVEDDAGAILEAASKLEAFLLHNMAHGECALKAARLAMARVFKSGDIDATVATAERFARYLENGSTHHVL